MHHIPVESGKFPRSPAFVVASAVLLLQALIYYSLSAREVMPATPPWKQFPQSVGAWTAIGDTPIEPEILERLNPDDYLNRSYRLPESEGWLNLFVGYFQSQRRGFLPHSPEDCLPGSGWKAESAAVVTIAAERENITVNEFVATKDRTSIIVLYWYQLGRRAFTSQATAQFYSLPELLSHGRTDIALVRVILPFETTNRKEAATATAAFAGSLYPLLLNHIK